MYSYGPLHMTGQKQDDQLEHTFSSYVRIPEALKTCQRRWKVGRSGERGSGISVLAARHDVDVITHCKFFTPAFSHGFYGSLGDRKSPQVSSTLLIILADIINAVVWMVSTHHLISKSSRPLNKLLGIVPSALFTIVSPSCSIAFLVLWQDLSTCLFFSLSLIFTLWSAETSKFTIQQVLFFGYYYYYNYYHHSNKCKGSADLNINQGQVKGTIAEEDYGTPGFQVGRVSFF